MSIVTVITADDGSTVVVQPEMRVTLVQSGPRGADGERGGTITGFWDMTGSAPVCVYPLDDDGSIPAAFGYAYAGPAVGDEQSVNYTRVGGATGGAAGLLAADPFGADSFDLPASGSVAVELHVTTAGIGQMGLAVLWHDAGTLQSIFAGASTSSDDVVITVYINSSGAITWALDGVLQSGSDTIPAGSKFAPYIFVTDQSGNSGTVTASLVTAFDAMLYAGGSLDICGTSGASDASLPEGAVAGSIYEVSVGGSYGDESFEVGDLAIVRSDGTSVTKLPAVAASGGGAVDSVNGQTGTVVLTAADVGAATSAQGDLADTAVQPADLATVAASGAYADLSGTPSLATVATSGAYADLSGAPSLATVATSGAYADLSGTPSLATVATSGAYSDLSGAPSIPSKTSDLTNDSGFLTSAPVTSVAGRTGAVTLSASDVSGLATVATSGAYTDLSGKPTIPSKTSDLINDSGFLTSAPVTSVAGRTGAVTLSASDVSGLATVATTGAYADLTSKPASAIGYVIDGGGAAITTGQLKGCLRIPFACTIESVTLLADQSGSIVVDIWKDSYANYPPTNADSICASAKPTLSSATKSEDTTLTGWTKTIAAGDVLFFNVDSATTVQNVTLTLKVTK